MEEQPASKPAAALCYFARLFQLEHDFVVLTAEERFTRRLEQEKRLCWQGQMHWRLRPHRSPPWARLCTIFWNSDPIWRTTGWNSQTTAPSAVLSPLWWAGRTSCSAIHLADPGAAQSFIVWLKLPRKPAWGLTGTPRTSFDSTLEG